VSDHIPILRFEIEGLALHVYQALEERNVQLDQHVKAAFEKVMDPKNLQAYIDNKVEAAAYAALNMSIDDFLKYGKGKKIFDELVEKRAAKILEQMVKETE
jgi:chemotaxis regulatin CheY-phosphate phosphatase CheZ